MDEETKTEYENETTGLGLILLRILLLCDPTQTTQASEAEEGE